MTLKTLLLGLTAAAAIAVPGIASAQPYDQGRSHYGYRYDGHRDYRHRDRWDRHDRYRYEQRRRWERERRHRHYRNYDRGDWRYYR